MTTANRTTEGATVTQPTMHSLLHATAYEYTNKPWHSFPAHVDREGSAYELRWGSDFVAYVKPLEGTSRVRVVTWHDNEYTGPAERVIPLALDDYLELRMAYR